MDSLKKRYIIWRLIGYYGTSLVTPPIQPVWLLFLVAVADGIVLYTIYSLMPVQWWARILTKVAANLVIWVPFTFFIVAVNKTALWRAAVPVTWRRPVATTLSISMISVALMLVLSTIGQLVHGIWKLLFLAASHMAFGWFATCILCALIGYSTRACMRKAFGFIGRNGNKVLIYVVLATLFNFLVQKAVPWLVAVFFGTITWEADLVSFLGLLLPALLAPIMAVMFLKVTLFPDAPVSRNPA